MNSRDKSFVIAGVIVCLVIAVLSPFIASADPDGLEKSAENLQVNEEGSAIPVPFPDYTIGALGDGPLSEIIALALGILIALWIRIHCSFNP